MKRHLGPETTDRFKYFVERKAERIFFATTETQRKKFDMSLQQRGKPGGGRKTKDEPRSRWVVNLSKHSLTEDEKSGLEKGLNFPPTP